jgi:hypothetical protein
MDQRDRHLLRFPEAAEVLDSRFLMGIAEPLLEAGVSFEIYPLGIVEFAIYAFTPKHTIPGYLRPEISGLADAIRQSATVVEKVLGELEDYGAQVRVNWATRQIHVAPRASVVEGA